MEDQSANGRHLRVVQLDRRPVQNRWLSREQRCERLCAVAHEHETVRDEVELVLYQYCVNVGEHG